MVTIIFSSSVALLVIFCVQQNDTSVFIISNAMQFIRLTLTAVAVPAPSLRMSSTAKRKKLGVYFFSGAGNTILIFLASEIQIVYHYVHSLSLC